jgi:hypothetical protein
MNLLPTHYAPLPSPTAATIYNNSTKQHHHHHQQQQQQNRQQQKETQQYQQIQMESLPQSTCIQQQNRSQFHPDLIAEVARARKVTQAPNPITYERDNAAFAGRYGLLETPRERLPQTGSYDFVCKWEGVGDDIRVPFSAFMRTVCI